MSQKRSITSFFGLHKTTGEHSDNEFGYPTIGFLAIPFIILCVMLFHWPNTGDIPTTLVQLNPNLPGNERGLPTDNLSPVIVFSAWIKFLGKYAIYTVISLLLGTTAYQYYNRKPFTRKSIRPAETALFFLGIGYFVDSLLELLIIQGVEKGYSTKLIVGAMNSLETSPTIILFICIAFCVAILKRSVALQDDVDSTI